MPTLRQPARERAFDEYDEPDEQRKKDWAGMERALAHAIDMNKNGELESEEFDEFQRWLLERVMKLHIKPEGYDEMRRTGKFDEFQQIVGHDGKRHHLQVAADREAIGAKVVKNFLTMLFNGGHIAPAEYAQALHDMGGVPDDLKGAFETDPESAGIDLYIRSLEDSKPPDEIEEAARTGDMDKYISLRDQQDAERKKKPPRVRNLDKPDDDEDEGPGREYGEEPVVATRDNERAPWDGTGSTRK